MRVIKLLINSSIGRAGDKIKLSIKMWKYQDTSRVVKMVIIYCVRYLIIHIVYTMIMSTNIVL